MSRRWLSLLVGVGVLAAFVVAAVLAGATALVDQDVVERREELTEVGFGWPVAWIHQDHSTVTNRLPAERGLISPWEYPTDVSRSAFLLDTLVVLGLIGALAVAGVVVTRLVRRGRATI